MFILIFYLHLLMLFLGFIRQKRFNDIAAKTSCKENEENKKEKEK